MARRQGRDACGRRRGGLPTRARALGAGARRREVEAAELGGGDAEGVKVLGVRADSRGAHVCVSVPGGEATSAASAAPGGGGGGGSVGGGRGQGARQPLTSVPRCCILAKASPLRRPSAMSRAPYVFASRRLPLDPGEGLAGASEAAREGRGRSQQRGGEPRWTGAATACAPAEAFHCVYRPYGLSNSPAARAADGQSASQG